MTTRTLLSHLSDAELLRHAYNEHNSLTVTTLEVELLARFERLLTKVEPLLEAVESVGAEDALDAIKFCADLNIGVMEEINDVLNEADIHDAEELEKRLTLADQFDELANDAGDVISRLQSLIESTTKE